MTITTIPLDKLMLSKLNVRHTERDADIQALAEDIDARGLKQNLVVIPAHFATGEGEDWADKFEVIAGGRRFQAMQLLVADGRLPADWPAPCLIEDRDAATETSLSENLHRVAMNPADEFAAFRQIIKEAVERDGCTHEGAVQICAKRFGKTAAYVEGRLRLADLAPEILDALRADKIGVEAAKAYASNSDHDHQRAVFALHEKDHWRGHKPDQVRSDMRAKSLPLDAPLVQFVGLIGYKAAGGRVEAEMFMGERGQERCLDIKLLEKLAKEIADATIPALAKRDGFKSGLFALDCNKVPKAPSGFERHYSYCESKAPTKAQLKQRIAVYTITRDGSGLELTAQFRPEEKRDAEPARLMTPEEQEAHFRALRIEEIAARLGVGPIAGTPFEGRASWPENNWVYPARKTADGGYMVAVLVKVTPEELAAQMEAATAQYEAKQAAAQQQSEADQKETAAA